MNENDFDHLSTIIYQWTRSQNRTVIFIVIVLLLSLNVQAGRIWPHHYDENLQELHKQLQVSHYSHLQDFQVVIPSKTDRHFQHITHHVRHKRSNRIRRDVIDDVTGAEENSLHYALSGYGENFKLHLEPNNNLLSPTFSVKRIKKHSEEEEIVDESAAIGCHFHGRLISHQGGQTSISTCDGLAGLLRTEEDDFFIEPVPSHVNHSLEVPIHPHVLYKKPHLDSGKHRIHYCGKKRKHPVTIPESSAQQAINLLSNGEIEFEEVEIALDRRRRSLEYRRVAVGFSEEDLFDHVIQPRERPRVKHVETLVVADRDMIRNHERDRRDVTTYILTIMNMVSGLYSDRSLDGKVNLVLSEIILLEDNQGLHLEHKADRSLASFCKWQYNRNYATKHPDHSILLTGIDICVHKNSPCETLGLAQIGGMCNKRHSCTINEDMGLGLAFTVAHETGHSFGMKHDGQGNLCNKRDGHIMSPTLNGLNGVFTWSACSREAINDFLNDESSVCLDDFPAPASKIDFPSLLPGELYDPETQCKWQFGDTARICDFRYEHEQTGLCKVLWCQKATSLVCETKYMPAAEGTRCGNNMWCRRGVCVSYGSNGPQPVDGGWGEFGPWSGCTRTCGGGVQYRERSCSNPTPQYGGYHCKGKEKTFRMCNVQKCLSSLMTFREEQCAKFNRKPYRRQFFNWIPFTKYTTFGRGKCELLCKAEGYDFFDMLADRVVDGTPCDDASNDVCIEGKCEKVGCDWVLGSNATLDVCGVCNGDNSTCETVTERFDRQVRDSGYYEVGRIPRGARNIRVAEEECCTHSYIAVKSATTPNTYHLNGNWQIDLFGSAVIGGVRWSYKRETFQPEKLYSAGPLDEDVIIEILIVSKNPGVKISYSLPNKRTSLRKTSTNSSSPSVAYHWFVNYTQCSSSCAGGTQTSVLFCLRNDAQVVDHGKCQASSKPNITSRSCNLHNCPARWVSSNWGECSKTCGDGEEVRQISCKTSTRGGDIEVEESECDTLRKPEVKRKCQVKKCPPKWYAGPWSKCSRDCGRGIKTRMIECRSGDEIVHNKACDRRVKPRVKERCLVAYCQRHYQWFITSWDECSTTCGEGLQRRKLKCSYKKRNGQYRSVALRKCRKARQPEVSLEKKCPNNPPCSNFNSVPIVTVKSAEYSAKKHDSTSTYKSAKWVAGTWQKCSASCGGGVQVRLVRCLHGGVTSLASVCSHRTRPLSKRSCNTYKCSLSASNEKPSVCEDNFSWCYLVPQHGQCSHSYFGSQCCKTCSSIAR